MRAGTCRSCKAAIVWIQTPGGKAMPCDTAPVYYIAKPKSGSKRIVTRSGEVVACEYTEEPHKATGVGYIPHWATCPQADKHRRRGNPT